MSSDPLSSPGILISAKDISCFRGGRLLFSGLDLLLERRGALRIVGANGSGKTSLLKILCGLLTPATGKVRTYAPFHFLGHKDGLADELTPAEMLLWYRSVLMTDKDDSEADINEVMARLHLRDLRDTPCRQLSAGQRRLVGIAKLMFLPRPLWILDEPFASLSSFFMTRSRELFAEHRKNGGGVIYSDHSGVYEHTAELKLTFEPR